MSSVQLALCGRIIKTGNITSVLEYGITPEDFPVGYARDVFNYILSYYAHPQTKGSVIPQQLLEQHFKHFERLDDWPHLTLDALCYEVRGTRVRIGVNEAVSTLSAALAIASQDPSRAIAAHQREISKLIELGTAKNTDMALHQGVANTLRDYKLKQDGANFSVMSWPWAPLQDVTFGVQPDDYVVFYGRPKSMKTWVLCSIIAWAFQQQKKVLIYTKEMTPNNIYARTIACIAQLNYDELRGARLDDHARKRLNQLSLDVHKDPVMGDMLTVLSGKDAPEGGDTVQWLESKAAKYKPDILFVDGLYLLSAVGKFQSDEGRVRSISRSLRAAVFSMGIPIIATMQANRKAAAHTDANLDEIAYSDALAQDTTIAARVINDKEFPTISVVVGGSREFKLHGFRIHAIPASDFSFHSKLTEKDIEKAKAADKSEVEDKSKATPKAPKKRDPNTASIEQAQQRETNDALDEVATI